jgi:hypothetical protein
VAVLPSASMAAELSLSREQQVLVMCARPRVTRENRARIAELTQPPFDWTRLIGLSEEHGLWPLVYTHTTAAGAAMPAGLATHLAERLIETTALNLALGAQLSDILEVFERAGIPAVALKGPVLAHAYGHPGVRPFGDLDVLVPRARAAEAVAALRASGYRPADQHSIVEGVHPAAGREFVLVPDRPDRVSVEVQVDVTNWPLPVALPAEALIERARPLTVGGRAVAALSAEDHVLTLAIHGTRHGWNSLRFISDIHAVAADGVDWTLAHQRAAAARMARMLNVGLMLADEVLGSPLPPAALDPARADRAAVGLARALAARLFTRELARDDRLWKARVALASREHLTDKVRYLVRIVAFEQVIRPLDEWRHIGAGAAAWRSAKVARRIALPLLLLAIYAASRTTRPLVIGAALTTALAVAYVAVHLWAARRVPVRTWSSRNA